jgi:MoaA/NifB/PqqE/SkfB family radical SAM enzyme
MEWWKNIDCLEIDVSSFCNARCPSCRRTHHVDEIPLVHFDLNVWKRLWTEDLKGHNIRKLVLNGNWGDSGMHKDLVEMLEYPVAAFPQIKLFIDTNGGMRDTRFWASLATILNEKYGKPVVRFGIDGATEESNNIYRVGVSLAKVLENAKAFIDAGGSAQWRMTVFDHNVDEIDAAESLAREYGFVSFRTRKSYARKIFDPQDKLICTTQCYDTRPHVEIFKDVYIRNIKTKHKNYFYQLEDLDHKCIWYREHRLQIDPYMNVWPCCHISGEFFDTKTIDIKVDSWKKYGFKSNNLEKHTLQEVLEGPYFTKEIDDAVGEARWSPCRKVCGVQK